MAQARVHLNQLQLGLAAKADKLLKPAKTESQQIGDGGDPLAFEEVHEPGTQPEESELGLRRRGFEQVLGRGAFPNFVKGVLRVEGG